MEIYINLNKTKRKMIDLRKNKTEDQPLPKWFKGVLYTYGESVTNPFSGETYHLTPAELSMYDFIMGCQLTGMAQNDMIKALSWFRKANPKAYMVLLD
jgi:hypothetical protein